MRLGFASIYSFRPHVEHLVYLEHLLAQAGHKSFFLTCDASVPACYNRLLKGHGKMRECPQCIAGGVRSYPVADVQAIRRMKASTLKSEVLRAVAESSSYTLHRTESPRDCEASEVLETQRTLEKSIDIVHGNAKAWIRAKRLDGVLCFNGRMDVTRAITLACEDTGIPFITTERTWFGHGLHLIPNGNCLSLTELDQLCADFRDRPLTLGQARLAGKLAAERFLQQNELEWRVYNPEADRTTWPESGSGQKVLILPSSKNEFEGHPHWKADWRDATVAMDQLLARLETRPGQVVLRCHPNWVERIGLRTGALSERHYTDWASARGFNVIASAEKASTYDLIAQADVVVVNGSSAGLEGGICGKKTICLGPATYQSAGFTTHIVCENDWGKLDALEAHNPRETVRKALRYIYLHARRFPQYVDYARASSTIKYEYFEGADPERIIRMLRSGKLEPDDPKTAENEAEENQVVEQVLAQSWHELVQWEPEATTLRPFAVRRRLGLGWIDGFRAMFPTGDR